ncbi:thiamine ABC transporter substrate binding subunit [Vibrio algivorus]|uniref:Thiamine-binding periplasmic protein n=1 Tax=Vibrio algivorus TaxID=1667024 RepID=A0A557PCY6_9VIBR|nr:thiamine ABC transporter substrate binding subunit [Vibrio algivorus]GLT15194.1 thiamine transporter substrate binding subunit [Vibrio algivorus]
MNFTPKASSLLALSCAAIFSTSALASSELAEQKPTLTVYTYDSFTSDWGPGPKIKQAFEGQCGCNLNFVALDDGGSVLSRIRLEGNNTKADVVLGLNNNIMAQAQQTGLLAKHDVDTSQVTIPGGWNNPYFVPFDYGYFAFVYNKTKMKNPPKSLKELVDRDDFNIIYQDPRTSITGQGLLLWVKAVYGDNAAQAWQKIADKTVTVSKGWSDSYPMFLKGESDMVLSYSTSPAYHIIAENDQQYAAANFTEGQYAQIELAAKVASTKHPKLADEFMHFILTDAFQSVMATGNWMYPVTDIELPKGYDQLTLPSKMLSLEPEVVAKQLKGWTREWQMALSQ